MLLILEGKREREPSIDHSPTPCWGTGPDLESNWRPFCALDDDAQPTEPTPARVMIFVIDSELFSFDPHFTYAFQGPGKTILRCVDTDQHLLSLPSQ